MKCKHKIASSTGISDFNEPFQTFLQEGKESARFKASSVYPWIYTCKHCGKHIFWATPLVADVLVTEKEFNEGCSIDKEE